MASALFRSAARDSFTGAISSLTHTTMPAGWASGDAVEWIIVLANGGGGHGNITPPGDPWRLADSIVGVAFTALKYVCVRGASNPPLTLSWQFGLGGDQWAESTLVVYNPNGAARRVIRGHSPSKFITGTLADPGPCAALVDDIVTATGVSWSATGWNAANLFPAGYTPAIGGAGYDTVSAHKIITTAGPENPGAFPAADTSAEIAGLSAIVRAVPDPTAVHVIHIGASIAAGNNGNTGGWWLAGTNGLPARVQGLTMFSGAGGGSWLSTHVANWTSVYLPQKHPTKPTYVFIELDCAGNEFEFNAEGAGGTTGAYNTAVANSNAAILSFVATIHAAGCKAVLILHLPNGETVVPNFEPACAAQNAWAIANASSFDGVCDIRTLCPDFAGLTASGLYADAAGAEVHPNAAGQNYRSGAIAAWFDGLLSSGTAAPVLQSTTPANSATGVSPSTSVALDFDVPVQVTSGKNFTFRQIIAPTGPTVPSAPAAQLLSTNGTTFTKSIPTVLAGDVVLLPVVKDGTGAITLPGDWNIGADLTNTARFVVAWKRFAADTAGANISITGASEHYIGTPIILRGAHPSLPPEFATSTGNDGAANPPSLTPTGWAPTTWPCTVGYCVGLDGSALASFTYTHPSGWTTNGGAALTAGTQTDRVAMAWSYQTNQTGASFDPGAGSHTSEQWMAVTWAIPAADPSTTIEVIPAVDSQVVVASDVVTITPASLPASALIEVLADADAVEAVGGSLPWAGLASGALRFTTSSGGTALTATGLSVATQLGSPALGQTHQLTAQGLSSQATLGAPALTQTHVLTAAGLNVATQLGSPALGQTHQLVAQGVSAQPTLGAPSLTQTHQLNAQGAVVQTQLGSPALSSGSNLAAEGLNVATQLGSPALGQTHQLVAQGAVAQTNLGSPALSTGTALTAAGLNVATQLGSPALGQTHQLVAQGVSAQPTLGAPSLTQTHQLSAQGAVVQTQLGSPALSSGSNLAADGLNVATQLGSPALGQTHQLVAQGVSAQPVLGAPSILSGTQLEAIGLTSASRLGYAVLQQTHQLVAQGVSAQPILGSPDVSDFDLGDITIIDLANWTPGGLSCTWRASQ